MRADRRTQLTSKAEGGANTIVHAIPLWSVWISSFGLAASLVIVLAFFLGAATRDSAGDLLTVSLSVAVTSSSAGNLLALALREVASENLSNYWVRVSAAPALSYLVVSTIILGIGTNLSYGRATLGIDATVGTGLSFLYICQITSVCTLHKNPEKISLGFLIAAAYSIAVFQKVFDLQTVFGVVIHLVIFGVTGLVMSLLANSIHDEMLKKSKYADTMKGNAQLWSNIARKAHQIAEMEDPSDIQRVVVETTEALGYEVSAITLLDKEHNVFRYIHPSSALPAELVNKELPLAGVSFQVLESRNTQILDYQRFPHALPILHELGVRTAVGIPMWNNGEVVAVLVAGSLSHRDIFADELTALELLAAVGSSVLEHRYVTSSLMSQIAQYNAMIEDSPNPTIVTDEDGVIILANRRIDLLLGFERQDLIGMRLNDLLDDPEPIRLLINGQLPMEPIQFQTVVTCGDNSRLEIEVTAARGGSPADQHLVAVNFRDISEQKEQVAKLLDRANYDPLTGLANRSHLLEELRKSVVRGSRTNLPVALIIFELDNYRYLTSSRGVPDKDRTLVSIAHNLESCVRETDLFARIGEDRFAILAENLSEARTLSYVQRLLSRASSPVYIDSKAAGTKATFGVSFATPGTTAETLLQRANSALLMGLTSGQSRITFFEQGQKTAAQMRLQLEDDLARALREQQFHLEFQPIVDMRTNRIVSAEALMRWNHPDRGAVSPNDFIPVAEETGMIIPIGSWVLRQASRQLAAWINEGAVDESFTLHFNVSRVQLRSDQIIRDIGLALDDFGLDSHRLSIEITESAFLSDSSSANQIIHKLSDLGVLIAIDDFGTGYSSLSMLTTLPVDILKIDKSFTDQLGTKNQLTIEAIVNMANRLHLTLVAEGIESHAQVERLLEIGCHFGQGYRFSHAVPGDDFPDLIIG